jgi:phosphoribosylamine--glycine ligase
VLNFVCLSENFFEARAKVVKLIDFLDWDSGFYRKDIGYRVIDK